MTVPCFLLAGCLFMPGHAHNAHAPHHRPAEHAGAQSAHKKPRRRTDKAVPLPKLRPKALGEKVEPAEEETAKPAADEEEKATPDGTGSKPPAAEKPAEEKPAPPLPEPKPEADEPGKTETGTGPNKPEAGKSAETPKPEPSEEEAEKKPPETPPPPDPACMALRESGMAEFEELPPLSEDLCGAPNPIRTTALKLADGTKVALEPAPVTRCSVIAALANWVREDVEPAAGQQFGSPVTALHVAASYVCRGRNGNADAPLSEHGHANAIDISAFKTKSGQWKNVKDMGEAGSGFLAIVRGKACGRFTTVIGPGLDQHHSDHLHFDTKLRGRNGRSLFCQ